MNKTTFRLITELGEEKTTDLIVNNCNKEPNSAVICEKGNECNYYVNRFKDFMERHKNCTHDPPEYYFGKMRKLGELTLTKKVGIQIKKIPKYLIPVEDTRMLNSPPPELQMEEELKKEQLKKDQNSPYKYKRGKIEKVPTPEESYGYKYCKAFTDILEGRGPWELSEKGKKWLIRTREDLQKYLEAGVYYKYYVSQLNHNYNEHNGLVKEKKVQKEAITKFYTDIELRNDKFKEFAFATHPDAYNPKEMSNLPINDLILIGLTPDFKEFLDKETWEQIIIVWDNIDMKKILKSTWEQIEDFGKKFGEK